MLTQGVKWIYSYFYRSSYRSSLRQAALKKMVKEYGRKYLTLKSNSNTAGYQGEAWLVAASTTLHAMFGRERR